MQEVHDPIVVQSTHCLVAVFNANPALQVWHFVLSVLFKVKQFGEGVTHERPPDYTTFPEPHAVHYLL